MGLIFIYFFYILFDGRERLYCVLLWGGMAIGRVFGVVVLSLGVLGCGFKFRRNWRLFLLNFFVGGFGSGGEYGGKNNLFFLSYVM